MGKWIKLDEQLPPFEQEIVLLSDSGSTKLGYRCNEQAVKKMNAAAVALMEKMTVLNVRPRAIYDENGLPFPEHSEGRKWMYWTLVPKKPKEEM